LFDLYPAGSLLHITEIPYTLNSLTIIARLKEAKGLIWYHGGPKSTEQEWISAWPTENYEYLGQRIIRSTSFEDEVTNFQSDWFEFLKTKAPTFPSAKPFTFTGGLAGHLSYDLGLELLDIKSNQTQLEHPLAVVGLYHWAINIDHDDQKAFIIIQDSCPETIKTNIHSFHSDLLSSPQEQPFLESDAQHQARSWLCKMNKDEYHQAFDDIKHYILEGDVYQVNLTRQWQTQVSKGTDLDLYKDLTTAMPAPFSVFHRTLTHSLLSVSPERFIKIQDQRILTQPIKGTISRGRNDSEDREQIAKLTSSKKDLAENLMIVDLLRNDLSKNALPGSIQVDKLFDVQSFKNVHHLVSTISADIKPDSHPIDVLRDAFPGGSITGAPKKRAMQVIDEIEANRRGNYCGCSFFLNSDGMLDSNILIRTITMKDDSLFCSGGGGIVYDSDIESEYEESDVKVRKILNAVAPNLN
jgi:para-aminobenzoate synthetase component 1